MNHGGFRQLKHTTAAFWFPILLTEGESVNREHLLAEVIEFCDQYHYK